MCLLMCYGFGLISDGVIVVEVDDVGVVVGYSGAHESGLFG